MTYKLYIDDLRTPIDESFIVVRNVKEAIGLILKNGMPTFISFDHDLGLDQNGNLLPSGYDFAKWIVEADMQNTISIPDNFNFKVHSQNPVGAKNILCLINSYLKHKRLSLDL